MAIFGIKEEVKINIENKEDKSLVPLYESEHVDEILAAELSGYKWEVTYFHREINEHNIPTEYDPNLDITLQDYVRVDNLVLRLESTLPAGIGDDLSSTAIIDIDFIPTPNDLFLTKLPDGRTVIYVITGVDRFNYNNESLFKIEFKLQTELAGEDDPILVKLLKSTTEEFIYNKDYRRTHTKPLYSKEEVEVRKEFINKIGKLTKYWDNKFITPKTNYHIAYIEDNDTIYDPQLEDLVSEIIGINNLNQRLEYIKFNDKSISILDVMVHDDIVVERLKQFYSLKSATRYGYDPRLNPIQYTGISKLVIVNDIEDDTKDSNKESINEFYPYIDNKYYIFRELVYKVIKGLDIQTVYRDLTLFEKIFLEMMTGSPINEDDIRKLYEEIFDLPDKEQFYFIPILIYILKYYLVTFTIEFI